MKKLLILFVLCLGFMSFKNLNNLNNNEPSTQERTCCTVPITFMGLPSGSIVRCVPGTGSTANALSCLLATNAARDYVKKKNDEFLASGD